MYETHGVNFSYTRPGTDETVTFFPVSWDIRSAGNYYRDYCQDYNILNSPDPVMVLLEEARNSGFNTAILRSELMAINTPGEFAATDYIFEKMANSIRSSGLNVILGGYWTSPYSLQHNDATHSYLADYVSMTAEQYPGDVIGIFGFDEPAVKFLENPDTAWDWINMVANYRNLCESEIGLPFMSYISKYGVSGPDGMMYYYSDTTSVLNRFARHLDIIAMNMYPIKNSARWNKDIQLDVSDDLFYGSTDLLPSNSPYYEGYCDKDEFFTVSEANGNCIFQLFSFTHTEGFNDIGMEEEYAITLPYVPTDMVSSDFRSCDIGDRKTGEHILNGAVVLWDSTSHAGEELVIYFDGDSLRSSYLPEFHGIDSARPLMFCVGQRVDPHIHDGILGRGDCAILGLYSLENGGHCIAVFQKGPDDEFELASTIKLNLSYIDFTGVLWGRFWGDYNYSNGIPDEDGGFILYDDFGQYICCRPERDIWTVTPSWSSFYTGLFGSHNRPVSVFVTNEDIYHPPYSPGNDYVTAFFDGQDSELVRARCSSTEGYLNEMTNTPVEGHSGRIMQAASFRPDKSYGERLICTTQGDILQSHDTMNESISQGSFEMESIGSTEHIQILPGARVMHTRRNIRSSVIPQQASIVFTNAQLYWSAYDDYRFNRFAECFEVAHDNAVMTTETENCVFSNLQSYGRHAFGLPSYCASRDTMLWMVTVPVIKGCRGINFYAMDLALMSGNRTEEGTLRYPDLMQNWGPSRDTGMHDMPGVIHSCIASLTGNGPENGPDFLSATVDPDHMILPQCEAVNGQLNGDSSIEDDPADTTLNFIALQNVHSASILMLVSNESGNTLESGRVIYFPNRFNRDYQLKVIDGFSPSQLSVENSRSTSVMTAGPSDDGSLALDFTGMPSVSVSLIELVPRFSTPDNTSFLEVRSSGGSVWVRFRLDEGVPGELVLYDIAGRKVSTIWTGSGEPSFMEIEIEGEGLPSGVYFIALASGHYFDSEKIILLR